MLTIVVLLAICAAAMTLLFARAAQDLISQLGALLGARTEAEFAQQFVFVPARRLLTLSITFALALAVVCWAAGLPDLLTLLAAALALGVPRMALRWLRSRRTRRLSQQLPDALTLWAGLLRAGLGATPALAEVGARQPSPLGDELRLALGQLRLGVPMEAALQGMRERADMPDLRLLATLLSANRELGGNLAEPLQRLADLLRGRLAMEARIESLTAQGRMQGVVVGTLPLLLLVVLYAMEPETMRMLHTTVQGWVALGLIAIMECVGFLLIRRIVRIDV